MFHSEVYSKLIDKQHYTMEPPVIVAQVLMTGTQYSERQHATMSVTHS